MRQAWRFRCKQCGSAGVQKQRTHYHYYCPVCGAHPAEIIDMLTNRCVDGHDSKKQSGEHKEEKI